MINALLYYRVSHEEQAKFGLSIMDQKQSLENYAHDHGYHIRGMYGDEGVSGKDMKHRKGFQRMLDEAQRGDVILVTKVDRFSRKLYEALTMIEQLSEKDINLIAIYEEDINTTSADGRLLLHMKLMLSEHEIARTSERLKNIMRYKRERGEVCHGNLKLGYKVENKHAVIVEEQASQVQWLFKTYIDVGSLNTVKTMFNEKYNHKYSRTTIRDMLTNDNYLGNKTYPPIIDESTFVEVQEVLKHKYVKREKSHVYIFSGLCTCGYCGRKMSGRMHKVKRVKDTSRTDFSDYKCNGLQSSNHKCCVSISEDRLEKIMLDNLNVEMSRTHVVADYTKKGIDGSKELESLRNKEKRLKRLYVDGLIEHHEMMSEINMIQIRIKELEASDVTNDHIHIDESALEMYKKLDVLQKNVFWRNLVDTIIIKKNWDITVRYK